MTAEAAIRLSDLSLAYPGRGGSAAHTVIDGLSLTVGPGEVLGLLGETGAGKSTLARVLCGRSAEPGELRPEITGGEATVLGHRLKRMRRREEAELTYYASYLQQDAGATLPPSTTIGEIIASPVYERDRRFDRRQADSRVVAMLDAVHLSLEVLDKYPYELSSGQRQRVALARALVLGPRLLIADEPTAGIDVTVRDAVVDVMRRLHRRGDVAALVISHDLAVLRRIVDRIAVLHEGRLVGLGTIEEVLSDPRHPYVAALARVLTGPVDRIPAPEDRPPAN